MRRWIVLAALAFVALPQAAQAAGDRILFVSNRADGARELYLVDRDGSALQRLTFNDVRESQPIWSPDNSRIAFAGLRGGQWDIYTVAADGSDLSQVTADAVRDNWPKWTSDGRIVYMRGEFSCPCRPWIVNADGSAAAELPIEGNVFTLEPSSRGDRLVYATNREGNWALHVAHFNGRGDRRITSAGGFGDFFARWSPTGKDIAFLRDTTGVDNDVWVVRANGKGLRRLTNTPGRIEFFPAWSSDGSEVLFGTGAGDLMAVSIVDGGETALSTMPRAPLLEDFSDGRRDASLWHQVVSGTGVSIGEAGGRLEVDFAAGAQPGGSFNQIAAHFGLQCRLAGDFDMQVAYELLEWPAVNGLQAFLSGFTTSGSGQIFRESKPWGENYGSWIDPVGSSSPTSDTAGSLRVTRAGGIVTTSYLSAGVWVVLNSGSRPEPMTAGVGAGDFNTLSGLHVRVAYDNFRLNSGELSCPTWWVDLSPDISFGPLSDDDDDDDDGDDRGRRSGH